MATKSKTNHVRSRNVRRDQIRRKILSITNVHAEFAKVAEGAAGGCGIKVGRYEGVKVEMWEPEAEGRRQREALAKGNVGSVRWEGGKVGRWESEKVG
jgi:hypothetical protein